MMTAPFQRVSLDDGTTADLFLLRYDKKGRLRSPVAEERLKEGFSRTSDVFLFSHGWNNTFDTALARYRDFISGYAGQRRAQGIPLGPDYRPVLVGVMWPSTSFLMPWEMGPQIAADPEPDGPEAHRSEELLAFVTDSLGPQPDAEFTELIDGRTEISPEDAVRAASIALQALRPDADPDNGAPPPSVEEFLATWAQLDEGEAPAPSDPDDYGTASSGPATEPRLASGSSYDPRNLLRVATVWKMKSRAGVVGANGVGPLARHVLEHSSARLHLIGHSFGARVIMSALATEELARPAHSLLLLQPAVNRWCFAPDVAGTGRMGGYHSVLGRVEKAVVTTFSLHDKALTKYFPLALRGGSLGEPQIAGIAEPALYGALGGGLGPAGLGDLCARVPAVVPGAQGYDVDGGLRLIAIDGGTRIGGKPAIDGHGDISNITTWWALHRLTRSN
ncbi:hypothetical protein [Streptacidiphilus sp. EB103A]|uniref:hypothetical protein n=1 Tax=Streptacidiphilus sp. EB103A TaxID=3156275 RepID=UPI003514B120